MDFKLELIRKTWRDCKFTTRSLLPHDFLFYRINIQVANWSNAPKIP